LPHLPNPNGVSMILLQVSCGTRWQCKFSYV